MSSQTSRPCTATTSAQTHHNFVVDANASSAGSQSDVEFATQIFHGLVRLAPDAVQTLATHLAIPAHRIHQWTNEWDRAWTAITQLARANFIAAFRAPHNRPYTWQ